MKFEFQSKWLREVIEILRPLPAICRYRVVPPALDSPTGRYLRRRILRELKGPNQPEP